MNRWLRFCLPIGSALITVAFIDSVMNCFWFLLQYIDLEERNLSRHFQKLNEYYESVGRITWNFLICIRPLLSLLLWSGVIFYGKKVFLISWIFLSLLMDTGLLSALAFNYYDLGKSLDIKLELNKTTEHIYSLTNDYKEVHQTSWVGVNDLLFPDQPTTSTTTLTISLTSFLIYRLILFIVGIEGVIRLHRKYDLSRHRRDADDISDIDICLEPVGFGFFQTWDYYKDLPGLGVCILLAAEMLWNILRLTTQDLTLYMVGYQEIAAEITDEAFTFAVYEEFVMRLVRLFLAFCGLLFVHNEKLNFVRLWICVYFLGIISSIVIFITYLISWGAGHFSSRDTAFYSIYISCDNLFRLAVLYFACKFAIVHRRTILKM